LLTTYFQPVRAAESGVLVMENVKKRGFVMYDKMRILPLVRLWALTRTAPLPRTTSCWP
jgi:hypothetical protein